MDWHNIDLKDGHERSQFILDPYSFDTLLLELNCNATAISAETIRAHFERVMKARLEEAREIFKSNLENIRIQAMHERYADATAMMEKLVDSNNPKTAAEAKRWLCTGEVSLSEGSFITAVMHGNYAEAYRLADDDNAKLLEVFI